MHPFYIQAVKHPSFGWKNSTTGSKAVIQELLAIQQQGPRAIGFFGTRNMGFTHQQLIVILSCAMVMTRNHIYTSGASGTIAAMQSPDSRAKNCYLKLCNWGILSKRTSHLFCISRQSVAYGNKSRGQEP
ncbi:hypothetical protein MKX03_016116 [Papaver bracteatum]|nr:hypothetical protein MKX03_016116 [Papaver bracteatum]